MWTNYSTAKTPYQNSKLGCVTKALGCLPAFREFLRVKCILYLYPTT